MKPFLIGIAGGSGSGKSTVAQRIATGLGAACAVTLDMDGYYRNLTHLSPEERRHVNWDHPNAFDLDLFVSHLSELTAGRRIERPVYNFAAHARRDATVSVAPTDVIVVEGILLFVDPRVRDLLDLKVFVDADSDIRLVRRIRRDMQQRGRPIDEILEQYLSTVRPMHLEFVEPTKRYADMILPRGGHNAVAIEMIVAKVRDRLTEQAS
ncbi:MAG TPA: uridine kinase [Gemmatimonadaceae bacterium]|jgi:uridine kinase